MAYDFTPSFELRRALSPGAERTRPATFLELQLIEHVAATVAGACVTILKALFNENYRVAIGRSALAFGLYRIAQAG